VTVEPSHDSFAPIAVVDRSGFDESFHHGVVVVLDRDGQIVFEAGDPDVAIYPRSSNKPMQADAMIELGVDLDDEQLAVACASHGGTERHVAVVRRILAAAGLGEEALANTPAFPLDPDTMEQLIAAGGHRSAILMNCSGKHAAMLATCRERDWPVDGYTEPDHPLQTAIGARLAELAGPVRHVGVDGCGAPVHALALRDLAAGFRTLATTRGRVWSAMTARPELVGGDRRTVTRVMRAIPGAMAKDGAQGVFAIAHPDGWAAALKVADGQERPVPVVLAAALAHVGIELDGASMTDPILGHGRPVGSVRSVLT
jgi:L-asparaginase II